MDSMSLLQEAAFKAQGVEALDLDCCLNHIAPEPYGSLCEWWAKAEPPGQAPGWGPGIPYLVTFSFIDFRDVYTQTYVCIFRFVRTRKVCACVSVRECVYIYNPSIHMCMNNLRVHIQICKHKIQNVECLTTLTTPAGEPSVRHFHTSSFC